MVGWFLWYLHLYGTAMWHIIVFSPYENKIISMKNALFWDAAPYRSCVNRRFGGMYRLHLQGRKIRERGTSLRRWPLCKDDTQNREAFQFSFLKLVLRSRIFYPEDGGDTFLRNVGSNKIYAVPPPSQAGSSLADYSILKMEAICSSETSVHTRSTRCHIPGDGLLHSHHRDNLKSYMIISSFIMVRINEFY
jgi:hypothetical protein